ncbi:uncharacterized protein isoform X2 [Choristoneura fumiferana]|uniref:uncharacterized protein isoform X2 n=1 Tax=Choristoneura fumiferana TaxID=7141 RepID=UPI003D159F36
MQPKMLKTMSRIKRVCAMLMVPRLFRGAGCTPGKFYRLQNEESPVLSRGFCKTDWTKPKYVNKPYSDVRSEPAEMPKLPIEDLGPLEKSYSLKFVVLRTLLKNADHIKIGVIKKKYQQLLVYIFGWPRPDESSNKSIDAIYESAILNTTTSKQNEDEKLTQKIEEITEVPLVEAEPRPDIPNPPKTSGPSVMTFENAGKNEVKAIDDLAKQYLRVVTSREKVNEQFLRAQMRPVDSLQNVVNCKPLDDTENPVQSKFSDDTDRFDTEDTIAEKKAELKTKEPHPKGDTMLIDITLFGSSCPRDSQSILKEAYEISRDSILAGANTTQGDTKTEATQLYTIYDELPEVKPNDKRIALTELLRRVRKRNQTLHQREMELQMSAPSSNLEPRKPGCNPPSPHIGQQPMGPRVMPQIQRPCPTKKREPMQPDAPAKKNPCSKCTPVKNPTTLALLVAPFAFPEFLPLLMCSISPMISYSVSKLNCAKVLIDDIKQRLFGYSELEKKQGETMKRTNVKIETKDMTR